MDLRLDDGSNWNFLGGRWSEDGDGVIKPPTISTHRGASAYEGQCATNADGFLAFHTGAMYSDFEAEFQFRWDSGHCGAGFIFRAQDARHYYLAHFPCIGQCARAEHFWALISRVDDTGWATVLSMEMLHGVATEGGIWHKARLSVRGSEFRLWVDGRPMSVVRDDTYREPGFAGLEAWRFSEASSSFRNIRIRGEQVPARAWDTKLEPPKNWFLPYPYGSGQQQRPSGITRASDGSLLMAVSGRQDSDLVCSLDNGRTWSSLQSENWPGGQLIASGNKRLVSFLDRDSEVFISESEDSGRSWSEPEKAKRAAFVPPENEPRIQLHAPHGFLELNDGTLLAFQVCSVPGRGHDSSHNIWEWGTWANAAYSIRSTDGGRTWSSPVPLNGPPAIGQKYDLCECTSTVQTREGKVLCLVRPIYSPWMWEIWSENGGESWGPATSGPFPCYAATALATSSGVLLVSGRMPGLGLYVSRDSGMTWQTYRIDTAGLWAMGAMYEVEPDLVLYVYMDTYEGYMRGQYIRITPSGVEPDRDMLSS